MKKIEVLDVKKVSTVTLIMAIASFFMFPAIAFLFLFRLAVINYLHKLTYGLVQATLVVNLLAIGFFIYQLMIKYGELTWSELGVKKDKLLQGVIMVAVFWIISQLLNLAASFITTGTALIDASWTKYGITVVLGTLIAQLFGNAFFEEMAYRGFLLPQIYLRLKKRFAGNLKVHLILSLVISQLIFSMIHIPSRIAQRMSPIDIIVSLLIVFALGVGFALIYIRTGNLFIAIGIHSLSNCPTLIWSSNYTAVITILLELVIIIFFSRFNKVKVSKEISA